MPSRSRALTSMLAPGVDCATDRISSTTGGSAHCIAKCKIVVPSNVPEDVPASFSASSFIVGMVDVSVTAFAIAARFPLRRTSKSLNIRTDCCIVGPASDGFDGAAASRFRAAVLGLDRSCPRLTLEGFVLWREERRPPKEWCEDEILGDGGSDPPSLPAMLVDSLSSVSTVRLPEDFPRCNNDLASADLERLWLQLDASLAMMLRNGELNGGLMQSDGQWCRRTHPSAPFSDMLKDQRLTSKVLCSIAAEVQKSRVLAVWLGAAYTGELGVSLCGGGFGRDEFNGVCGVRSTCCLHWPLFMIYTVYYFTEDQLLHCFICAL